MQETRKNIHVIVKRGEHAWADSFTLRYGILFPKTQTLVLKPIEDPIPQKQKNRFSVEAAFEYDKKTHIGTFIYIKKYDGNNYVVTVMDPKIKDSKINWTFSEACRSLRQERLISVEEFVDLHPRYESGELRNIADLWKYVSDNKPSREDQEKLAKVKEESEQIIHDLKISLNEAQKSAEEERKQTEMVQKDLEDALKQIAKLKLKTSEEQLAAQEIENAQKLNKKLKYSDPYKLIEVNRDIKRGSGACTQLVFANGDTRYILVQNYDRDLKVTQKAESLRGKNVKVSTWMGGDKDYSSTYFNNIYETNEVASSNQIIPNSDPRIINKISPRSLKIRSVSLVPGTKFQPNWRKEMYEIETDIGIFIAPTIKSQQENVQGFYVNWNNEVGKILQVWSSKGMGYYWLHLCSPPKSAGSSLDDEIPF